MSGGNRLPKNLETIFEKRRGSAAKFLGRLRSGSLPGYEYSNLLRLAELN